MKVEIPALGGDILERVWTDLSRELLIFYEGLSDHERARRVQNYGTFRGDPNAVAGRNLAGTDVAADCLQWLFSQFTKGSIFLVALVLLVVACQSHPVLYTIGFFCIWSLLIVYFKVSY
ncbi:hypothetical protein COOONC_19285 [Cooperia oncophora]